MGEVSVGWDERLERKVALKSIRAEHRLDAESRARFLREARLLSQLAHPGICQIFDRGGTLAERLERAKRGESRPAAGFDPDLVALVDRMKSPVPAAGPSAIDVAQRLAWVREKPRRRAKRALVAAAMAVLAAFGAAMTVQTVRARELRELGRAVEASALEARAAPSKGAPR